MTSEHPLAAAPAQPKKKKKKKGPLHMQRYGGWLLYFWHGMRFGAWLKLLARGRFDVTVNCLPNILTVTLWTPVNSALYYLSEAIYRRRAESIGLDQPPVFVLGHWRSGTTLLHDLLACDPAFAYPTTYECFFPNHFLLSERALAPLFRIFLPKKRPQDDVPVGLDRPQEEEFALAILGMGTPYNTMAWPRHGPADMDYLTLERLSDDARRKWMAQFLWFYRRIALKHNKPLIMKSPTNTARVRTLLELFPDARFIHIARNPLAVVPSTVRLWKAIYSTQGLHNPPRLDPWIEDFVIDTFAQVAQAYEAGRGAIPKARLVEIRYEDFVADPQATLHDIYQRLDLGPFARTQAGVEAYLAERKEHRRATYERDETMRLKVLAKLGAYIDRFGYRGEI